MSEKILRNPTQEELKLIKEKNIIKSTPKKKENTEIKSKPTSIFEPKAEEFILPSGNLEIPEGKILVRRMTTIEEGIFQETVAEMVKEKNLSSALFLESINKVIDNCIKSSDVSVYDLSLIDKSPLFIFILGLTYGFEQTLELQCNGNEKIEGCKKTFAHKINLGKLDIKYVPEDYEYPKIISLEDSFDFPVKIELVYPKIGDEAPFISDTPDVLSQFLTMLKNAEGTLPDGNPITEEHYEDICINMHPDDKDKIKKFINDFSEFGSNVYIKKKVCKNPKCVWKEKRQKVLIPMESIFLNVF